MRRHKTTAMCNTNKIWRISQETQNDTSIKIMSHEVCLLQEGPTTGIDRDTNILECYDGHAYNINKHKQFRTHKKYTLL